ncbi:putative 4-hydroxyphenylpyruvate dioxygenase [Ancylostoma duodenale]|uniref:4-hydroxyphenylpyruvate dioxygenase n=1 Tax=Ancylostoma duodenale TaxID=51022 RepID=A0A0C2GNY1_9BILA|nr:putative 4-hydroxyphenylpyruvate dioxygenase [Ancylostoma duodenale]
MTIEEPPASFWYCCCFGFSRFAIKKEENSTSIAIRNGRVVFVMKSTHNESDLENSHQMSTHGDAVKDVAFHVDNIDAIEEVPQCHLQRLIRKNVEILLPKTTFEDKHGSVTVLKLQSNNEHFYVMSIDDKITTSEFSAMKAWLITNEDQKVQMTLAEAVLGRKGRSQIEEFVSYNGGPGIQHIALLVDDIVETVTEMRKRSVEFLHVPSSYYDMLEERLKSSKVELKEDMAKLRKLCILMDFDDNGYLLQLFTKPVQDRPTLFIEIIQRRNFNGFGAGNFKALFDAVEREQKLRGTLYVEN